MCNSSRSLNVIRIQHHILRKLILIGCLVGFVTTFTACQFSTTFPPLQSGEVNIPFETIDKQERSSGYTSETPKLVMVTSPDQLDKIENWVVPNTLTQIRALDFQHYFIIAVFRGVEPSSNYQTVIERITQKDSQLIVYVQFWEPNPAYASATVMTSPYHLVKVRKEHVLPTQVKLVLQSYVLTPTP